MRNGIKKVFLFLSILQFDFLRGQRSRQGSRPSEGFTLLELLIVIVMTGILSAIALPTFLNQRTKAQETEGKTYIGSMNRAQQAHYAVYQKFTGSLADLGLGIRQRTRLYEYDVTKIDDKLVTNKARSQNPDLRGYAGVVASSTTQMGVVLCRSTEKGTDAIGDGTAIGQVLQCPQDYEPMP